MEYKNINKMSLEEKKAYYQELKEYYEKIGLPKNEKNKKNVHKVFNKIAPMFRKYDFKVENAQEKFFTEPKIFITNHSNGHDYYTIQETFKSMIHVLAASDCLDKIPEFLFNISGVELIDRLDSKSCYQGLYNLVRYLSNNESVLILPEATWNIHPSKPMLPMKHGAALVAQMSGKPIVPIIFEYVEKNGIIKKESNLYKECIVHFLDEVYVSSKDDLNEVTRNLRDQMATARWNIWEQNGIRKRDSISNLEMKNNTEIKYNSKVFNYDRDYELQFILGYDDPMYEYYPINGIDYDEKGNQILKKIRL